MNRRTTRAAVALGMFLCLLAIGYAASIMGAHQARAGWILGAAAVGLIVGGWWINKTTAPGEEAAALRGFRPNGG